MNQMDPGPKPSINDVIVGGYEALSQASAVMTVMKQELINKNNEIVALKAELEKAKKKN